MMNVSGQMIKDHLRLEDPFLYPDQEGQKNEVDPGYLRVPATGNLNPSGAGVQTAGPNVPIAPQGF